GRPEITCSGCRTRITGRVQDAWKTPIRGRAAYTGKWTRAGVLSLRTSKFAHRISIGRVKFRVSRAKFGEAGESWARGGQISTEVSPAFRWVLCCLPPAWFPALRPPPRPILPPSGRQPVRNFRA